MTRVFISADAELYGGGQPPLEEVRTTLEGTALYAPVPPATPNRSACSPTCP
jgi:hypothetical protein